MTPLHTDLLDENRLVRCLQCGVPIFNYATPEGKHVALDDAPGDYVIEGGTAYRSTGQHGYRGHWDHCKQASATALSVEVADDDFLWPN